MKKQPWEKLGLSELSYLMAYTQGCRDAFKKPNTLYKAGTPLRKAYNKGRKETKNY